MKVRQHLYRLAFPTFVLVAPGVGLIIGALGGRLISPAQAAGEAPQEVLAAQIRLQGFSCDKALGATRDARRSKPDHAVWVLKCNNATYRVSRFPDMAAKVEALQ